MNALVFKADSKFLLSIGPSWKNCGLEASPGQESALAADRNFQNILNANYKTEFSQNQQLFNNLTTNLGQITNAGVSQQGFSAEELAAKNSENTNAAAAANQKLQTAIGENAAGKSNATPGVESGVVQAERAAAASQVEGVKNTNVANITQQNYDTGRQNYWTATENLERAPSAFEAPSISTANAINSADANVSNQANANQQANAAGISAYTGLAEGVAKSVAGGFFPGKVS